MQYVILVRFKYCDPDFQYSTTSRKRCNLSKQVAPTVRELTFSTQPRVVSDAIDLAVPYAQEALLFQYSTTSRKRCNPISHTIPGRSSHFQYSTTSRKRCNTLLLLFGSGSCGAFSTQPRVVSDAILSPFAVFDTNYNFQYSTTSRKRCNVLTCPLRPRHTGLSVLNHES